MTPPSCLGGDFGQCVPATVRGVINSETELAIFPVTAMTEEVQMMR